VRSRIASSLESLLPEIPATARAALPRGVRAVTAEEAAEPPPLPPELNWRDYTMMLLHTAAEIEHSLMVQYLFAAYSLGGPQVPDGLKQSVRRWQEVILGIAKEEMGHLVTVQNLTRFVGGTLKLDREDVPWSSPFYPFDFALERLTLDSLARYICAESPPDWKGAEADEIRKRAEGDGGAVVNRVGALYERLSSILGDPGLVVTDDLRPRTYPYQASWDEWGRGYRRGLRGQEAGKVSQDAAPELLVIDVYSRESALAALEQIGEQGEALVSAGDETSHFRRFLTIYDELKQLPDDDRGLVTRPLATNPRTTPGPEGVITDPEALCWAHLFNVRYRMLLLDVAHAFRLAGPLDGSARNARGLLVNRAFAEMYNLRAIAGMLVQLPLEQEGSASDLAAGPPFEMPYTLELPLGERDCWLLHRDVYEAAGSCIGAAQELASGAAERYLVALAEEDATALRQIERILAPTEVPV
jgi:hypothetical protein